MLHLQYHKVQIGLLEAIIHQFPTTYAFGALSDVELITRLQEAAEVVHLGIKRKPCAVGRLYRMENNLSIFLDKISII